jgi:hypothetical protein
MTVIGELDVVHGEAACSVGCLDIATGAAHDALVRGGDRQAVAEQDVAELGLSAVQASGEPEAAREDFGGVVEVCGELVEKGAVGGECLFDCGVEELGARLYPRGIATATPQTFTVASRAGSRNQPGSCPPRNQAGTHRSQPRSARFELVGHFRRLHTPVPRVLLFVVLAGPAAI